jgi:hypothetical protein
LRAAVNSGSGPKTSTRGRTGNVIASATTWLGRFASIHLPEADQAAIEAAQSKPPEPFSNKGRADYLRVTWEMRQALKLWSFAACDMTPASAGKPIKSARQTER